jgi:hypothetical protein
VKANASLVFLQGSLPLVVEQATELRDQHPNLLGTPPASHDILQAGKSPLIEPPTAHWQTQRLSISDLPSEFRRLVFNEKPGDKQGGNHRLCSLWATTRQTVGIEYLLDAFKQDFNVPLR